MGGTVRTDISRLLRDHRIRAGWSQEELAERSGVSSRTIGLVENGARRPRLSTITLLAEALGLDDSEREKLLTTAADDPDDDGDGNTDSGTATAAAAAAGEASPTPDTLPYPAPGFVGRAAELAVLLAREDPAPALRIVAVDGMAGVGKTALAVTAAHMLAERFPDGRFFLDLHGFTPRRQPVETSDALARLLAAAGTPPARIPVGEAERADLWRTTVARHRILLVLDNAVDEDHVRPLIAGGDGTTVIVTSRHRLRLEGATVLSLDVLPEAEALELFTRAVGDRRTAEEPGAVAEVVLHACGRLPLALCIASARLVHRATWTVGYLASRLAESGRLLPELEAGAGNRGVAAALDVSYRQLPPHRQRTFALLGLCPGDDFDAYAVAALTGTGLHEAGDALEDLVDQHLVLAVAPTRYGLHDLVRAHAQTIAADLPPQVRTDALAALAHYQRHVASVAVDLLWPATSSRRPTVPPPAGPTVPLTDRDAARAWLSEEHRNLIAGAVRGDVPGHASTLSVILGLHLDASGFSGDAVALHQAAVEDARACQDNSALAAALNLLGITHSLLGANLQAVDHLKASQRAAEQAGDRRAQMRASVNLAVVYENLGRFPEALDQSRQGLRLAREVSDTAAIAPALNNVGTMLAKLDRTAEALDLHQQALSWATDHGNHPSRARAHNNLGADHEKLGDRDTALRHHHLALAIYRDLGDVRNQAHVLADIGDVLIGQGEYGEALGAHREALRLAEEAESPPLQAQALNGIGDALASMSEIDAAHHAHRQALARIRGASEPAQRERAEAGLARGRG